MSTKHPILRAADRFQEKQDYVLIGSGPKMLDEDWGEVWTRRRSLLRRLMAKLDDRGPWQDSWPSLSKPHNFRPWLNRKDAEVLISDLVHLMTEAVGTGYSILMPGIRPVNFPSVPAERIFNMLVADKVLRNPAPSSVRGLLSHRLRRVPLKHTEVFMVDPVRRDEWFGVRLLLLDAP